MQVKNAFSLPTNTCQLCFLEKSSEWKKAYWICSRCDHSRKRYLQKLTIQKVKLTVLFHYDEFIEGLLYRFKGLGEQALSRTFFWGYRWWFSLSYWNALLVLAPRNVKQDEQRRFSPLRKIFSFHPNLIQPFEKTDDYKQSDQPYFMRKKIRDHVWFNRHLMERFSLKKRIIIVDDVVTSGETMKMMISHLRTVGFSHIEAFAISRPTKA